MVKEACLLFSVMSQLTIVCNWSADCGHIYDLLWSRLAGMPASYPVQVGSSLEHPWDKGTFIPLPRGRHQPPWWPTWICACCLASADLSKPRSPGMWAWIWPNSITTLLPRPVHIPTCPSPPHSVLPPSPCPENALAGVAHQQLVLQYRHKLLPATLQQQHGANASSLHQPKGVVVSCAAPVLKLWFKAVWKQWLVLTMVGKLSELTNCC